MLESLLVLEKKIGRVLESLLVLEKIMGRALESLLVLEKIIGRALELFSEFHTGGGFTVTYIYILTNVENPVGWVDRDGISGIHNSNSDT